MSAPPTNPLTSTGRGGAGNIGHDKNTYVDAGIVREGYQGESAVPEYSSGRGGAGNIVDSPRVAPSKTDRTDQDYIPETSLRQGPSDFHTGRGGGGNIHREKYGGHTSDPTKPTLGDKIKGKVEGLLHKKEKTPEPAAH